MVDGERDLVSQQCFAVFDGKDQVVVSIVNIVPSLTDGHASSLAWKPTVSKPSLAVIAAEPRGNRYAIIAGVSS